MGNEDRGVAARVIQAQRGASLTQGELAGCIGITEDKLSKSLHGKRRFSSLELALISEATQVPVGDLLGMQVKVYTEKLEAEDIDRLREKLRSEVIPSRETIAAAIGERVSWPSLHWGDFHSRDAHLALADTVLALLQSQDLGS